MSRPLTLALFTLTCAALGCTKSGTDDSGTDDSTAEVDVFGENIFVTESPVGDLGCYAGDGAWLSQSPDPSCAVDLAFTGEIEDFETGDNVDDCDLQLFFDDTYEEGGADYQTTSDASGAVAGTLKTCTPTTYRTTKDPALELTQVTIQAHEVFGFSTSTADVTFNSVSSATYNVIPSLLGVSVKAGFGIVAGTAYDCNEDPLQNAQVVVKDADGNYPEDQRIHYFVDEFPNRNQKWTSEDGLWVAVNIPPGEVTVEMYTWDGAAYVLQGTTALTIVPDSINIANAFTGYDGGVVYPDSCLSACN